MHSLTRAAVVFWLAFYLAVSCVSCSSASHEPQVFSPQRDKRWAVPVQEEGLPNLFQVTPDLYRSAQPDQTGMRNAEKMGIRTVLSLRTSNPDPELSEGTGLELRRVPIATENISEEEVVAALRIIREGPHPVLVHCRHGADRTGLVIAVYRMAFQGWTREEALNEMRDGGFGFHSIWINIPKMIRKIDIEAIRAKVDAGSAGRARSSETFN